MGFVLPDTDRFHKWAFLVHVAFSIMRHGGRFHYIHIVFQEPSRTEMQIETVYVAYAAGGRGKKREAISCYEL